MGEGRRKLHLIYSLLVGLTGISLPVILSLVEKPQFPPTSEYLIFLLVSLIAASLCMEIEDTIISFEIVIFYFLLLQFGPVTASLAAVKTILTVWLLKTLYDIVRGEKRLWLTVRTGIYNSGQYGWVYYIAGKIYPNVCPSKYAYLCSILCIVILNEIFLGIEAFLYGKNIKEYLLGEALLSDVIELCIYPFGIAMTLLYSEYGFIAVVPLLLGILLLSYLGKSMSDYHRRLERRITQIKKLNEIARNFGSILELEKLVNMIVREACDLIKAEKVIFCPYLPVPGFNLCRVYDGKDIIYVEKVIAQNMSPSLKLDIEREGNIIARLLFFRSKGYSVDEIIIAKSLGEIISISLKNAILYMQSITDGLTGLYTRRCFENRLAEEIDRSDRYGNIFTLIMFDLDNFKKINDQFGHIFGDHALKEFARRLSSLLRKSDFAARWGGDEFVVILPGTDKEGAEKFVNRLLHSLSTTPCEFDGKKFYICASHAMVTYIPGWGITPEELFYRVDTLLLKNKSRIGAKDDNLN